MKDKEFLKNITKKFHDTHVDIIKQMAEAGVANEETYHYLKESSKIDKALSMASKALSRAERKTFLFFQSTDNHSYWKALIKGIKTVVKKITKKKYEHQIDASSFDMRLHETLSAIVKEIEDNIGLKKAIPPHQQFKKMK